MKKILALTTALMMGSAYAQMNNNNMGNSGSAPGYSTGTTPVAQAGSRHMFEFNIDSVLAAAIAFDKSKVEGESSDNDMRTRLSLNYAYGVHSHVQAGFRFNYLNDINGNVDQEGLNLSVGGYLNHSEDFARSAFLGLFVGGGYTQTFGGEEGRVGRRDNIYNYSVSVGKRMPLERFFGIKHVSYTPEIAFTYANSNDDESFDYQQALEFRLLQFSVFF